MVSNLTEDIPLRDNPNSDFDMIDSARPSAPRMRSDTVHIAHDAPPPHGTAYIFEDWLALGAAATKAYSDGIAATTARVIQAMLATQATMIQQIWTGWENLLKDTKKNQQSLMNLWMAALNRQYGPDYIEAWVRFDAEEHQVDDGTSPGGRFYSFVKDRTQELLFEPTPEQKKPAEIKKKPGAPWASFTLPGPLAAAYKIMLKESPAMQDMLRDEPMVRQFESIDRRIKETYFRLYPEKAAKMRWHGTLFDPQYNHQFLTETRPTKKGNSKGHKDGDIVAVDVDKVVGMFKKPISEASSHGKDYPHVIITFSHAQGETDKDVKSITHGIESQAYHSEGKRLPFGYLHNGEKVTRGHTVMLYACDVEETPWKNGAALLKRILELKRIAATGEPDREFNYVSPAAKRTAKLMLKCMVAPEDAARIDVNGDKSLAEMLEDHAQPIKLREDAVHIANHFQLVGYSKGGNVASDAMRYLIFELTNQKHGRGAFVTHECKKLEKASIRSIVRSIATLAIASVEVGLSEFDKEHGLRRLAVNNENDLISAHKNYGPEANDERWMIRGKEEHMGHAPHHYFGERVPEDERVSEEFQYRAGYGMDDERVNRRLKEFYAPHYGKAAIAAVHFGKESANNELYIETAPGTTDAQLAARIDVMKTAFQKTGLNGVNIERNPINPGFFTMKIMDKSNIAANQQILHKIHEGFKNMLDDKTNRLVIAQTILEHDIGEKLQPGRKRA